MSTAAAPEWFRAAVAVRPERASLTVGGVEVTWRRWGARSLPPLVLVHGAAAHGGWWEYLAPLLAARWCVVAPDLSGHGDSAWRDRYDTRLWADEVVAVTRAALGPDGQPPVLAGHSLGASVACAAAALHGQQFRSLVICDLGLGARGRSRARASGRHFVNRLVYATRAEAESHFALTPRQPAPPPWLAGFLASGSVRPVGPKGPGVRDEPAAGEPPQGWTWKFDWRLFHRPDEVDLRQHLSALRLPSAFLGGSDSRVATRPRVAALREACTGGLAEVWVPCAHHHLMVDQPLAFVAALEALAATL